MSFSPPCLCNQSFLLHQNNVHIQNERLQLCGSARYCSVCSCSGMFLFRMFLFRMLREREGSLHPVSSALPADGRQIRDLPVKNLTRFSRFFFLCSYLFSFRIRSFLCVMSGFLSASVVYLFLFICPYCSIPHVTEPSHQQGYDNKKNGGLS